MDDRKADELIAAMESLESELSTRNGLRADVNELSDEIRELNQTLSGNRGSVLTSGREGVGDKLDNVTRAIEDLHNDVRNLR